MKKLKILPVLIALLMFLSMGASAAADTTYNTSQISTKAGDVKYYVEKHYKMTSTVTINGTKMNTTDYLYLLTQDLKNVNEGDTSDIEFKKVGNPVSPSETLKAGTLSKTEYLKISNSVLNFINTNDRAPSYATTSLGKIQYENLVYTFSKILDYYNNNGRLPNSVSVRKWSDVTSTSSGIVGGSVSFKDTSHTTTKTIGSNSLGTVQLIGPFGTGKTKVAVIVGVHPQEGAVHVAMMNALKTLASKLNNVKIWVFKVNVKDKSDYETSRMNGQKLANKYVVPKIDTSYKLVLDAHGNRGLYATNDFVFAPSKGSTSVSYANKIIYYTNYLKYNYVIGSSPDYVTIPIANKGIPSVVFELYTNVNYYNVVLYNKCLQVVKGLNYIFA